MSAEEKTEKATPRKLKESRKEGKVARTPELGAWSAILVVAMLAHLLVGRGLDQIRTLMTRSLMAIAEPQMSTALTLMHDGTMIFLTLTVLLGALIMLVSVALAVAQGGLFFATKSLKPKASRLSPLAGAKRMFGPHALWEGTKMLIRSSLVALFVWRAVNEVLPVVGGLMPVMVTVRIAADAATGLMRDVALAGLVAAAVEYGIQRRRTGKQVRMTKKEVRDEHKQSEGDPMVRSAIRSRQLAAARNRMMADVATADVVLTNPTHVAVALRYQPEKGTPRVVAKGAGVMAARIRELAEEHRVAMVADIPLARALHASCEVGQEIPAPLFHAVAQVLAFVLSRRAAGSTGGRHQSPRLAADLPEVGPAGRRAPDSSGPRGTGR